MTTYAELSVPNNLTAYVFEMIFQSLVEQKVLSSLNKTALPESEWKITVPRSRFFGHTQAAKLAMVQVELSRMLKAAETTGEIVDSVHLRGEPLEQWKLASQAAPPSVSI